MKNKYKNWGLDQHPAPMLQKMEQQIRQGQSFISIFRWSKKYKKFLSESVDLYDSGNSYFLFKKGNSEYKIKMWDGEKIKNPLKEIKKGESLKQKAKRLMIEKKAFTGTNKLPEVEEEIKKLEKEMELAIDEIASQ